MSKYLITRYGGIGDTAPVSVAAKQLVKRGHEVTMALRDDGPVKQTDLFVNQDWVKTLDYKQIGPWATRCVPWKHGWIQVESTYDQYDTVVDMMFSIEANSTCKSSLVKKVTDVWERSRNSNWVNWYDLNLMWVNVDPTSVPDEEKRPSFKLSANEKKISEKIKKKFPRLIVLNPTASSLARTWYQAQEMVPMVFNKWKDATLALWNPRQNDWVFHNKDGPIEVKIDIKSGLRKSLVILDSGVLYIGVDTGLSHMAEGLNKQHIAIYSTVPAWTRNKYYKYQTAIDHGKDNPEYYSFAIMAGDPLNMVEGEENLTPREKIIRELYNRKAPTNEVCKKLNTDSYGARLEFEALNNKFKSFERMQSKALSTVTPEEVFSHVEELCQ